MMKLFNSLIFQLVIACSFYGIGAHSQDVNTVISTYFKAIGELDNWKKVESIVIKGLESDGIKSSTNVFSRMLASEYKFVTHYQIKKNLFRRQINEGISRQILGYDGKNWWAITPDDRSIKITGEPATMLNSDFFKPSLTCEALLFIDYKAKGYIIEYIGKKLFENINYEVLKVSHKQKMLGYYYFNAKTGILDFRLQSLGDKKMGKYFQNYKKTGNLLIPYKIIEKGSKNSLTVNYSSCEINASNLTNSLFVFDN